jgi:putative FmdB family regulatory protein
MPIYEFKCSSCGHKKEILMLKESDWKGSHKLGCDKCKGMYERVLSAPNFKIKGFSADNNYSSVKEKTNKDGRPKTK